MVVAGAWVVLSTAMVVAPGTAPTASVPGGLAAYYALDYAAAIAQFEEALRDDTLTTADRQQAYAYLGRALAALRRHDDAVEVFGRLLRLEPGFRIPPNESPLIQRALSDARARTNRSPPPRSVELVPERNPPPPTQPSLRPVSERLVPAPPATSTGPVPSTTVAPWWRSPTPWLIGGGLLTAVAATLLATRPWQDDPAPAGTLGRWSLP